MLRICHNLTAGPDAQQLVLEFPWKSTTDGRWDLSFWDEKFNGYWTLVGCQDDGSLAPTRFESYVEFQKRVATCD
jgi:hypothetical protein